MKNPFARPDGITQEEWIRMLLYPRPLSRDEVDQILFDKTSEGKRIRREEERRQRAIEQIKTQNQEK